jgi:dTDP-4-dehydrorhamnose reductase
MRPVDLLIIGGSGFVGAKTAQAAAEADYNVAYTYWSHRLSLPIRSYQVNLVERNTLEACINEARPRILIYCAVPRGGELLHRTVSVSGVQRTLTALNKISPSALFIYVSTNSVFSGRHAANRENDLPDPEVRFDAYRAYAITRAEGERETLTSWKNSIVVRTSNVDGRDIQGNLSPRLGTLVENLQKGQPVSRFTNRLISPTLVDNIVDAALELISDRFQYRGILHVAGSQPLSDYDYTLCLARHLLLDEALVKMDQVETSSPTGILNISLDGSFTQSLLQTRLLNVEEQLARIFPAKGNNWE